MGSTWNENTVELCGEVQAAPAFSHSNHNDDYYFFPIKIDRLSGAADIVNVIISQKMLPAWDMPESKCLRVTGELRTYNNKSGQGSKLVITVLARRLEETDGEPVNKVCLCGTICKKPVLRRTPMGRDICDIMLAVNRRYGRADYLPCITWGQTARDAALLDTGSKIRLEGRIQSRAYIKTEDGVSRERVAFEVSAMNVSLLDI